MRKLAQITFIILASMALASNASAREFAVEASKTRQLELPGGVTTIVIGDPRVADIAVHDQNLIFITGRTIGTTNLLAYNAAGKKIFDGDVVVTTNAANFVSINRAGQTNTFDCAPRCRSIVAIGDERRYFNDVVNQARQVQRIAQEAN